jgi:thiol:disulfide interchange protein
MFGPRREAGRRVAGAVALLVVLGVGSPILPADAQQISQRPAPASAVISAALKAATADRKVVLIEFGASWCTWCRRFDAFVHAPEVASIVAANFIVVNLVVQERDDKKPLENPGGQDMMNAWGGAKSGLPFYVFLDGSGKKIANSNAMPDGGNIGFPGTAKEVGAFLGLLDKTAPRMSRGDRAKIASYFEATIEH